VLILSSQVEALIRAATAEAAGLAVAVSVAVLDAGGIPLRSSDGQLLGAIGVSGGQVAQDHAIAQIGLATMNS
jgi:uncharacterized protein GlcG (DUF336 family)